MKPPSFPEAAERGLIADDKGIYTFSNGTHWDGWAEHNCYTCKWWDKDTAGAACAFEAASFLGIATPELAKLFGWTESAEYPGSFSEPETCRFHRDREDDDDGPGESAPPPFIDPNQLTFLPPDGWPTSPAFVTHPASPNEKLHEVVSANA